jgi:hypothetical protein
MVSLRERVLYRGEGASMVTDRTERLAPLAGVLFTVVFAIGFLTSGETPDTKATGQEVISHYDDSGGVLVSMFGLVLAAVLFMFFAGVLRSRLQATGPDWLASVAFGGAVVYTVSLGLFAMGQIALVDAADLGQPEVAQALNIIDNDNFFPAVIGLTVVLLATGWHILASRSLPTWLGWASVVLGILALAGPLGFIAFLLFPIWILVVSIMLYRQTAAPVATTTTAV